MKSPFPGMDPFLEHPAIWMDFNNSFLAYLREVIAGRLPDHYDMRLESQIRVVDAPPVDAGDYRPDLSISRNTDALPMNDFTSGVALLATPEVLPLNEPILEEVKEYHIDIYRDPGEELVTTIELLSPWNKSGDGYVEFLRKRRAVLASPVNWVEVDFLIAGERVPFGRPPSAEKDYRVVVSRTTLRPNAELYAWNLRQPLPIIPIPLREPDAAISISLGEVFAMTYDRGRFDKPLGRISPRPLRTRIRPDDKDWAHELALKR